MRIQGWKPLVALALLLGAGLTGCKVPPIPASAQAQRRASEKDPYDGWLFGWLTGQREAPFVESAAATAPAATGTAADSSVPAGTTGAVQQASATLPAAAPSGSEPDLRKIGTSLGDVKEPPSALQEEKESGVDWSQLEPENIWKNVKNATGFGPDEKLAQQYFNEGMALYREKKFDEAAEKFKSAAGRWPDSTIEEDALFFQAESYFFADRYDKAHDTFLMLFKKYQNTRYLDVAVTRQFSIGRYWEQMDRVEGHFPVTPNFVDKTQPWFDTFGNSVNAYLSVRLNDPTGPLADDSIMATANAYFVKGRYEDAAYHYDLLRKEYPKSEHQVQAHVLALKCKQMVYQGPMYDGKPLDEGEEIARQALTQFRGQLGSERTNVTELRDQIRAQKAERRWAMAQFYETKRAYGAARLCYQDIVKDYPQTELAASASQRLEAIKDFPAEPPDRFKWLTGTFDLIKDW